MLNLTLSHREKKLLTATLAIVFMVIFYLFILEPQIKKLSEGRREINKLSIREKKFLQTNQTKGAVEKKYLELRKKIIAQAPREEELSKLLSELENSTKAAKILPISIEPLPIKEYELYRKLSVEMTLQGDIASLVKFLYNLQCSSERFIIDKLLVRAASEKSKLLSVKLSISILLSGKDT